MKASELRIGNLVGLSLKAFPDNFFRVIEVSENSGKYSSNWIKPRPRDETHFYDIDIMEAIPLNEKTIAILGFFRFNNAYVLKKPGKDPRVFHFSVFDHGDGLLKYNSAEIAPELKYVHQLQNLYFALTGEELILS